MGYEDLCRSAFEAQGPFWHLYTDGNLSGVIFREHRDYVLGMNMVAYCANLYAGRVRIYTFQIMSNHFHFVVAGEEGDVADFFESLKGRLKRCFAREKRGGCMKGVEAKLQLVDDLGYLRNLIVYVNRNGYVASKDVTPYLYRWGANCYFFSLLAELERSVPIGAVTVSDRRGIFHTHEIVLPESYCFIGGYVSPSCYCMVSEAEQFFHNAHHYFGHLTRRVESFAEIARQLGDMVTYTDEEMYVAVLSICNKDFQVRSIVELTVDQKLELARKLRFGYNASNRQIVRILRLDEYVVNSMFPERAR